MTKMKGRLVLFLVVLALSLFLLVWAFWPAGRLSHFVPLPPNSLHLPTPAACLRGPWAGA